MTVMSPKWLKPLDRATAIDALFARNARYCTSGRSCRPARAAAPTTWVASPDRGVPDE